jgi:flavin-dependent dehydrogenase
MIQAHVIIAGAGPAGSACALELKKYGIDALILDRQQFPRTKLCAGWITPKVLNDLELEPEGYPGGILTYRRIVFYLKGVAVPVATNQYSIRRKEFDHFLLKRSGAAICRHHIKDIRRENGKYIIDGAFASTYLVGAGGTHCPVYKSLFAKNCPRDPGHCIATVEEEFKWPYKDPQCRLWFFDHGLAGYAWYVPKQNGYLNIGIGGKLESLKRQGQTIKAHWNCFVEKLSQKKLVSGRQFSPKGHLYYLRGKTCNPRCQNAFIIGDAAGLATRDMGEGIGPAIESGKLAARSIALNTSFSLDSVTKWSLPQILTSRLNKKNFRRKKTDQFS